MKTRRQFINKLITVVTGVVTLTACRDQTEENGVSDKSGSTGIDRRALDAVVDAFVPRDQDAGAVEAGVTEKLLELFDENEDMKLHGEALLGRVEVVAQHKYRRAFSRLNLARREEIIRKTLHSRSKDDQSARHAISLLRGQVIKAYYLSPAGQAMLGYTPPYPNGYPDFHIPPVI